MINVGIVGLGYWGPNLLRNFYQLEGCHVKYGCDLEENIIKKYSLHYPNIKFTVNYDKLVINPEKQFFVIPVKTGIQSFQVVTCFLDTRFRGYDDFLRMYQL